MSVSDNDDQVEVDQFWIQNLSTSNYFLWSRKIEIVLRGKGLWKIVSGEEIGPDTSTATGEEMEKFYQRRDRALTTLLFTIDDACSASVISLRNPKEIWDTLKARYETISQASIDALLA